ncbi:male-specific lethal 1 homolog isoform X2 [Aplysia californica]|uniref:Male-specific lethal 1 homolog isoform X2 n=1 Tax=Aplysia californica TaxID=6500 RepID=A0ABM0JWH1_APLCA|nr:male-specific lethal 1 homolog isoform X2 [Aplysia californica]XP_005103151.1 male-specific lethal 1 homolog isoform X2 [Aplysia californica]XP_005103152.1 male-specific lethal 1 homolog isoform X2 [Aplysia californica]
MDLDHLDMNRDSKNEAENSGKKLHQMLLKLVNNSHFETLFKYSHNCWIVVMKFLFGFGKFMQLQCRLERMERRMSILKHREEPQEGPSTKNGDDAMAKVSGSTHSNSVPKGKSEVSRKEFKRKRRGTKSNFSQRKQHKHRKLELSPAETASEKEESDDNRSSADSDDEEDDQTDSDHDSNEKENESDEDAGVSEIEEKIIDYPIMQTETLYHLYYPKHVFASVDTSTIPERPSQLDVETPSWRLKPLTNMYQLEGTENITDEAYYKRHQKFEMEEKRRKRWDLQRIRELRVFEKLQKQKEDELRASQDEVDVETFLPSVQDLKHIEVTESLPVMAFGQPVPYVSPAEFEIPWEVSSSGLASSSRQRSNSSHSRRH